MKGFTFYENEREIVIGNRKDYFLETDKITKRQFSREIRGVCFKRFIAGRTVYITGRDASAYGIVIGEMNPKKHYLEIGAGLGGVIPGFVERFGGEILRRPTIIDPANYNLMQDMMKFALRKVGKKLPEERIERIRDLQKRCGIILDPRKVDLINMTLGEAADAMPYLFKSADVVIEKNATFMYPFVDRGRDTSRLRKELLRIGGELILT